VAAPDGRAHVLIGLGGTGKSAVALRVAETALAEGRPVWWVPAADESSLTSSLLDLAQVLGADAEHVKAARIGLVDPSDVLWQQLETSPGWLLVIDNVDDIQILAVHGRQVRDGNGWVRSSRSGLVMVSSRDGDPRHWGRSSELHSVGWLSDEDGGRVLLDLAPRAGSRLDAEALSGRLGGLALALHHAGLQLSSPFAEQRKFRDYQNSLESRFPLLLQSPDALEDREIVARTWELSLNQLARSGLPQARAILEVLAWFRGAVPIPIDMLNREILAKNCSPSGPRGVSQGLEALLSVGLIETRLASQDMPGGDQPDADAIMLHPLVVEITRHLLSGNAAANNSALVAVELLAATVIKLDPDSWDEWDVFIPHLDVLSYYPDAVRQSAVFSTVSNHMNAFTNSLLKEKTRLEEEKDRLEEENRRLEEGKGRLEEEVRRLEETKGAMNALQTIWRLEEMESPEEVRLALEATLNRLEPLNRHGQVREAFEQVSELLENFKRLEASKRPEEIMLALKTALNETGEKSLRKTQNDNPNSSSLSSGPNDL
jgi:hypothetical protein